MADALSSPFMGVEIIHAPGMMPGSYLGYNQQGHIVAAGLLGMPEMARYNEDPIVRFKMGTDAYEATIRRLETPAAA